MSALGSAPSNAKIPHLALEAGARVLAWGNPRMLTETPDIVFTVPSNYGNWRVLIVSWAAGYHPAGFNAIAHSLDGVIRKFSRQFYNFPGWKPHHLVAWTQDLAPGSHTWSARAWSGSPTLSLNGMTWSHFVIASPIPPTLRSPKRAAEATLGAIPSDKAPMLGIGNGVAGNFNRGPIRLAQGGQWAGAWTDTRASGSYAWTGEANTNVLFVIFPTAFNTVADVFSVLGCYMRSNGDNSIQIDMGLSFLGFNEGSSHHAFPPFVWYGQPPVGVLISSVLRYGANTSSDFNDRAHGFVLSGI